MLWIGSHVGFNKKTQLVGSVEEAASYGSNTFMFYTGAPQNTTRSPIDQELVKKAKDKMKEAGINVEKVIVHAPYIINLCNEGNFTFSVDFLTEEVKRVNELGISYLVLHPGSHVGLGIERGIENIAKGLNQVFEAVGPDNKVTILLETMAGKGSEVGSKIEELKEIMDKVTEKEKLGICLDTCHLNDSGYDMSQFDDFLNTFESIIPLSKIGCVHINDSKNELSAHKDRHENIGFGTIGFDTLIKIIYHEKLEDIPKILETPYVNKLYPPYKQEIEMIRKKEFNEKLIDLIKE